MKGCVLSLWEITFYPSLLSNLLSDESGANGFFARLFLCIIMMNIIKDNFHAIL